MCMHTTAEHESMKRDGVWETLTPLEPVSFQPGDDEHGDLELRNAPCGSTLSRPCMLSHSKREEIRAANRARSQSFRAQVDAARMAVAA